MTTTAPDLTLQEKALASLSRAAEFIATHPDLPVPTVTMPGHTARAEVAWHLAEDHHTAAHVINALPGDWRESGNGQQHVWFTQVLDDLNLTVHVNAYLVPVETQRASLAALTALGDR